MATSPILRRVCRWGRGTLLDSEDRERAGYYRATARKLRELAAAVRYDFRRRQPLLALAAGFDRAADREEMDAAS